jgi:hypothetical protein
VSWLSLVVASLAVYRCARMIAQEDGPFDVFARLRAAVGQASWVGRGFHCVLCVSFWLAWIAVAMVVSPVLWREYILSSLGVAGGSVVIYQVVR